MSDRQDLIKARIEQDQLEEPDYLGDAIGILARDDLDEITDALYDRDAYRKRCETLQHELTQLRHLKKAAVSRTLTINQTYQVNGYDVEAQLDPTGSPARLTLWADDGHGHHRLTFVWSTEGWFHESGAHPDLDALCDFVNLAGTALCNGLV